MLILSRKEGDFIQIGDDVRIVVLSADRKGVRLGIEAPSSVRILRGEIVADVERENTRATEAAKDWLQLVPVAAPGATGTPEA